MRRPLAEGIDPNEAKNKFENSRNTVTSGHITRVVADQANSPIGRMCRTKQWRPSGDGSGISDLAPGAEGLEESA